MKSNNLIKVINLKIRPHATQNYLAPDPYCAFKSTSLDWWGSKDHDVAAGWRRRMVAYLQRKYFAEGGQWNVYESVELKWEGKALQHN